VPSRLRQVGGEEVSLAKKPKSYYLEVDDILSGNKTGSIISPPVSKQIKEYQQARKTPANTKSNLLEVQALTDIKAFAELIGFHGGWSSFAECHDELADFVTFPQTADSVKNLRTTGDELASKLRRLILMPRGHLKSTVCTCLYVLWRIYRNPNIRILVGCNLQSLAFSFIRELRSYFENPELDPVWNKRPHIEGNLLPALDARNRSRNRNDDTEAQDKKVIWNNAALQVLRNKRYKEPTVFATSVGTTITGQHYDLVILDDIIDFKNIESEQKKERVEEWIADIESVLNPVSIQEFKGISGLSFWDITGGELVVTGTRYALDDYYGQIKEKAEELEFAIHERNIYRNGKDSSDGYLWADKFNDATVERLQARLSPRRFASQYLNTVYEKDTSLFNTAAITVIPDNSVFTRMQQVVVELPNGRLESINPIIAIDPAFSANLKGDDCAMVVGGKLSDGRVVLIDAFVERAYAADLVKVAYQFAEKYLSYRAYYEENGVGKLVGELFAAKTTDKPRKIICYGHYEQRNKETKIQGVLELPINSGAFIVTQRIRNNEYIWRQLSRYPATRHDDFLDALVTLFEKSLPSRDGMKQAYKGLDFDPYRLKIDSKELGATEERSFLAEYNSYYR
jgi:predicted phage terminase large subunit-like protein